MKLKPIYFLSATSLILFIILTAAVTGRTAENFNSVIYTQIQALINPFLTNFLIIISKMGEWFIYAPVAVLFLIIPKSRIKIGVPVAAAIIISVLINLALKQIFIIPRPDINRLIDETGYGYPSGHAMNGTVFIGLCAYLFNRFSYKKPLKITMTAVSFSFMLLMGFSRIYLGVHSFTDVTGGYLAGVVILTASIIVMRKNPEKLSEV